jgi:hypothetical protein
VNEKVVFGTPTLTVIAKLPTDVIVEKSIKLIVDPVPTVVQVIDA